MDWDPSHPPTSSVAPPHPNMPQRAEVPQGDWITLDVSGHKFRTRKSTHRTSPYFNTLFEANSRWDIELLSDGSYAIDADPDTLSIILKYMRRPSVFLLLWTKEKGFDYVAYNDVLAEADFCGLEELKDWIMERRYLKAVETGYKMEIHPAKFNTTDHEPGNYNFLHVVPPSKPDIDYTHKPKFDPMPWRDHGDSARSAMLNAQYRVPQTDTLETGDIDLVNCFEINVPSRERCKCPQNYTEHVIPELCEEDHCIEPVHDSLGRRIPLEWEELPSSIVTVLRTRSFLPEACMEDYHPQEAVDGA